MLNFFNFLIQNLPDNCELRFIKPNHMPGRIWIVVQNHNNGKIGEVSVTIDMIQTAHDTTVQIMLNDLLTELIAKTK